MRGGRTLFLGLLTILVLGCAGEQPVRSTSWLQRLRPLTGPTGPNVILMHVSLLERPFGDRYADQEVWDEADEQIIPLERKAALEDNGFRVGHVGGITPNGLLGLLLSPRYNPRPRGLTFHAGDSRELLLEPSLPECRFETVGAGPVTTFELEQAQFVLTVNASLTADGRTLLRFTPLVRHGEDRLLPQPAADRSGFVLRSDRPAHTFADLGWEVTLAPNEYVLIGGRYDRPGTLGHCCFLRTGESPPVQRLLVIRTGRNQPGVAAASLAGDPNDPSAQPSPPPLAAQAGLAAPTVPGP